jgi:hypothetical protein
MANLPWGISSISPLAADLDRGPLRLSLGLRSHVTSIVLRSNKELTMWDEVPSFKGHFSKNTDVCLQTSLWSWRW